MSLELPTVSVVMAAYNYEQYVGRALESALAQDYPAELLEIIVIDDGSTDSTPQIVDSIAASHPGRVRVVHQDNAGYIAATNRGLAEARGELIALLDADDVWRADKTRRQVELFQSDPALGLVFSDMAVIDADEAVLQPSKLTEYGPIGENRLAALLFENFATTSSIMVRASLRHAFHPVPPHVHAADWWIAFQVALRASMDFVPEALALYRVHGGNMSVGGTERIVGENRRAIALQLWALRHLPLHTLTPQDMLHAWSGIERHARWAVEVGGSFFFDQIDRQPGDDARAGALLAEADAAAAEGNLLAEARLTLKALAWDPFRLGTHQRLRAAVERATPEEAAPEPQEVAPEPEETAPEPEETAPDPFPGARPVRILVELHELLDGADMLLAYAEAMRGAEDVTLIIDGSELPSGLAQACIQGLIDRCGLSHRADLDVFAVVETQAEDFRRRMLAAVHARYSRQEGELGEMPVFTPSSIGLLAQEAASR
jgi:hypothetical protein